MKIYLQILILALLLILTGSVYAQEDNVDVDLFIGASMPELYHAGIRFHMMPKSRLDFNFGSDFNNDGSGRSYVVTINHAYYFGRAKTKVKNQLWSINTGFSFLIEKRLYDKSTAAYINLYFARELPISRKIFIQPELGVSYFLFEHIVDQDNFVISAYRTRIVPKFGLNLIFKI